MSTPFEIMCNASDYVVGAVLGQSEDKNPIEIAYTSKTLIGAQLNYATTKKNSWLLFLLSTSLGLTWLEQKLLFILTMQLQNIC
jgi:hypothetical protein